MVWLIFFTWWVLSVFAVWCLKRWPTSTWFLRVGLGLIVIGGVACFSLLAVLPPDRDRDTNLVINVVLILSGATGANFVSYAVITDAGRRENSRDDG